MLRNQNRFFAFLLVLLVGVASAQERRGIVTGRVMDASQAMLQGARVQIVPGDHVVVSDAKGQFTISGLAPGNYTIKVYYLGFDSLSKEITVAGGQIANVDAVLEVAKHNEQVTVTAGRQFGEVEALNRERTADNILQVLPSEVITSLPNTNVADAIGRLPSVSLERDEGEGKYIQIRGTEPRLSNVTVDGIHLPSPENVRNVKLDVIPADLVDSVELSKTLAANQDAGAIGGSVNLVMKTAQDFPYINIVMLGGYTPISNGRWNDQFAGTVGERFGKQKKFGVMLGGSYDWNQRAIEDLEPGQAANPIVGGGTYLGPNTEDIRQYLYNRTRYGFGGGIDYKLGDMSSAYLRGLFSRFNDYGQDWIYTPTAGNFLSPTTTDNTGSMSFTDIYRQPEQQIFSLSAGAHQVLRTYLLNYELGLSQAKSSGGYPRASFNGPTGIAFGADVTDPFVPKFPVLNGVNINDPTTYALSNLNFQNDSTFERDVVGAASMAKQYSLGSHFSAFEMGLKIADARKTQNYDESSFSPNTGNILMNSFLTSFRNTNYYFNNFNYGPVTNYNSILAYYNANPGQFSGGPNLAANLSNDFDISERIYAGYAMNTVTLGKFRWQMGLRVESTQDSLLGNIVNLDNSGNFASSGPFPANNSYTNFFPSTNLAYRLNDDTILRAAWGMGIARPNFGDLAPYVTYDPTSVPPVSAGNPNLTPTHSQNFDLLVERYLKPVGILQGGFFYKYLTDPIYVVTTTRAIAPYAGSQQTQPVNGPSAHVAGVELSWAQPLRFLPGVLNGMGVRANYSYTTSQASFPSGFGRTDSPALIRQAPNNYNLDFTYDKWGISARMGLTHNDAYIWSYGYQDGATGGINGPLGDTYLYPHTQVDAQASYLIPNGHGLKALVSMLNLTNEVFGFYNGSERYPIQREYYNRTFSFGLQWTYTPAR